MLDNDVTAAYVAAGLGSATIAFNHLNTFWDLAEKLRPRQQLVDKDTVLIRLWMRARHWLDTVVRLDRVSDLQAVSIANRTLFELAVDMLLIARDKSNESGRKLTLWSESDRIKHFENVVRHYVESGQQLPTQFAENLEFHQSEKAAELEHSLRHRRPVEQHRDRRTPCQPWNGLRPMWRFWNALHHGSCSTNTHQAIWPWRSTVAVDKERSDLYKTMKQVI